ncbi:MAG: taurine transporter permease [Rhodospirillales bacterium]|nr:taurine transporter permease [Rhodospirillales bacterium]
MSDFALSGSPVSATLSRKVIRARRLRLLQQLTLGIGFPVIVVLLWQAAAVTGLVDRRFFPAPSDTIAATIALLQDPDERARLLLDMLATYRRLVIGFTIGATLGVVTGVGMALSRPIRDSLGPTVSATFPTPKLAIFPLLIVIFGLGDASKVVLIALGVFYMTCLSSLSGVLYASPLHRDVAKAFRIPAWTRWTRIVVPSAMPSIVTGLKLGLGQALILVVSAEFVSAQEGLGHFIWDSWQVLDVPRMFMGLVVVGLTGGAAVLFGEFLERRLIPWAPKS